MKTGEFDPPEQQPYRQIGFDQIRTAAHLALTRQVATESFVLLANKETGKGKALPFAKATKRTIAVVGPFADCQACYFGKYSPHIKTLSCPLVAAKAFLTNIGATGAKAARVAAFRISDRRLNFLAALAVACAAVSIFVIFHSPLIFTTLDIRYTKNNKNIRGTLEYF